MPDKPIEGFEIIETPEDKFTLRWGNGQAGPFSSKLEAESAMERVIANVVHHYDKAGKFIRTATKAKK